MASKEERREIKEYRRKFKTKEGKTRIKAAIEKMRADEDPHIKARRLQRERLAWVSLAISFVALILSILTRL